MLSRLKKYQGGGSELLEIEQGIGLDFGGKRLRGRGLWGWKIYFEEL
jgi:hypothetical protein